jgi:hypothetical protein
MKLESKHSRHTIVECLKNNLNKIGFSIVWIQAESTDRFYIYIFDGFLNQDRANTIQDSIFDKEEMPTDCVCLIKLTFGSPYTCTFRPDYPSYDRGRLKVAVIDSFNDNRYIDHETDIAPECFGGAKIKIDFKEMLTLPKYAE